MLQFMYSFTYRNTEGASTMTFDAKVYSIADRYGISALKEYAKQRYDAAIESGWALDDFCTAINSVYSSTAEHDRGLRDSTIETCIKNIGKLLESPQFCQCLRETIGLAADMVLLRCGRAYRCPSCHAVIRGELGRKKTYYCIHCGHSRSDWSSYEIKDLGPS